MAKKVHMDDFVDERQRKVWRGEERRGEERRDVHCPTSTAPVFSFHLLLSSSFLLLPHHLFLHLFMLSVPSFPTPSSIHSPAEHLQGTVRTLASASSSSSATAATHGCSHWLRARLVQPSHRDWGQLVKGQCSWVGLWWAASGTARELVCLPVDLSARLSSGRLVGLFWQVFDRIIGWCGLDGIFKDHSITEWSGLEGTSVGHLAQPSC